MGNRQPKGTPMKNYLLALPFLLSLPMAEASAETGLATFSIPAAHHVHDMEMAVMFPSTGGSARLLGENPVFHGTTVYENAEPLTGKHPVVLLSHGWGGNFARMSWLASGLVERGAIVVAVNHPNSTTGDFRQSRRAQSLDPRARSNGCTRPGAAGPPVQTRHRCDPN